MVTFYDVRAIRVGSVIFDVLKIEQMSVLYEMKIECSRNVFPYCGGGSGYRSLLFSASQKEAPHSLYSGDNQFSSCRALSEQKTISLLSE